MLWQVASPTIKEPGGMRAAEAEETVRPPHFLADLYTFKWTSGDFRLPGISAAAVGLCLLAGVAAGHPAAGMIAGGGALTIGFGAYQRISDSRVLPMMLATFWVAAGTLTGTLVGHRGYALLFASAVAAAIYSFLTMRSPGIAWVSQQAAVALFVSSAFASGPKAAFARAGLISAGSVVQMVFTSAGLRMMPELRRNVLTLPKRVFRTVYQQRRELLMRLRLLPQALPAPERKQAMIYALRMTVTVVTASELYRRLGIQSGYWIPMTALLVQKPAFFETLTRGVARALGTLAGATLTTVLVAHVHFGNWWLACLATFFAYWSFATLQVNYALYSLFLTSYIVFLLSLNQLPGPEIAHRRALCTAAGAAIALLIHLDALRRHRAGAASG